MPVQIVIAGKAHPQDVPGKTLIRDIVQFSRDPELAGRVVFVEDYGLDVAAEMVEGVDVWLNTPRRGEEASGTSGMKAGINGVLNLSILDGWFDEALDNGGGWAIGERDVYSPDRDDAHAAAIYTLLENEIGPLYYLGREEGVPEKWIERMRQCISVVSANYNCQRMVGEYNTNLYLPANRAWETASANNFAVARQYVAWSKGVNEKWNAVRFLGAAPLTQSEVLAGSAVPLRVQMDLGGLTAEDVRVEAVVGRVGPAGDLEGVETFPLLPLEKQDGTIMFGRDFSPRLTGRLGYSVRVSPNHSDDPLNRPCNAPMKWMS
jgi:starch phosphorylase